MNSLLAEFGGQAYIFLGLCSVIVLVVLKIIAELVLTCITGTGVTFSRQHKRAHISFLLSLALTASVFFYVLFSKYLGVTIMLFNDKVIQILIISVSVSFFLVIDHLKDERKGVQNGKS